MISHAGSLQDFLETIDAPRSRVTRLPHRIWLFGGQCAEYPHPLLSLRDAFNRACHSRSHNWIKEIVRPEDYPEWLEFSGYKDLLLFERDAGLLSRAIVLFVESPGAIAELGAFSLDDELHKKLFVVISRKYREHDYRRSFLNLGPLKRLESLTSGNVDSIPNICVIDAENPAEITAVELDTIFQNLDVWLDSGYETEGFRKNNPTHKLLLIADLVDVLQILSERQVLEALQYFNVEIEKREIQKLTRLLDLLDLIRISERGNERFLVTQTSSSEPLLDYTAREGNRFDRLSFKTKVWTRLKSDPHLGSLLKKKK